MRVPSDAVSQATHTREATEQMSQPNTLQQARIERVRLEQSAKQIIRDLPTPALRLLVAELSAPPERPAKLPLRLVR